MRTIFFTIISLYCLRNWWWVLSVITVSTIDLLLRQLSLQSLHLAVFLELLDLDVVSDIFFRDRVLYYITKIFLMRLHQHLHWTSLFCKIRSARFAFSTTEEACVFINGSFTWSWLHIGASLPRLLVINFVLIYLVALFFSLTALGPRWEIDQFFHLRPLLNSFS